MSDKSKFKSTWFYASVAQDSKRHVDLDDYSKRLVKIYEDFDSDGYDIINVIPINFGESEPSGFLNQGTFSITRGATVIAKRRDDQK